jgi:hypothetical protein
MGATLRRAAKPFKPTLGARATCRVGKAKRAHASKRHAWATAKRPLPTLLLLAYGACVARQREEAVELGKQERADVELRHKDAAANQTHELGG